MNLNDFIIISAIALRLIAGASYIIATIKGRAQPNPISWLLWGIMPVIAFVASIQAGVGHVALTTLALGVTPILVFFVAMIKQPRSLKLTGFNLACIIIALIGIIIWQFTQQPTLAILMMVLADFFSSLPTIRKAWHKPSSEFPYSYFLSALSMVMTLLAISHWDFASLAYPVYVLSINFLIFCLAMRQRQPN